VIAAVVALALVGGGFMLMAQTPKTPSGPTVPSTPAQPTQPTAPPTEQPTEQPTEPTQQPTQPTGGAVDLGYGVQFAVADGWEIAGQGEGVIKVQDGKAMLITEVQKLDASNTATQLCEAYSKSLLKDQSGVKFAKAEKVAVNAKNLSVAKCLAGFVQASGGSSGTMYAQTFAAVRSTDGVTSFSTVVFTESTPQTSFDGVNEMLNVVLGSQAAG